MKTFNQFITWMRAQQAWDEFFKEHKKRTSSSLLNLYNYNPENIIAFAFPWACTAKGYDYWSELAIKWKAFYRQENIKKYKLVYISKRIASVELPNPTINVIEFVKTSLKEKHPTITIFEWEGETLYGCEKEMKLVKI